jgi:Calx-beta domain-containing protein
MWRKILNSLSFRKSPVCWPGWRGGFVLMLTVLTAVGAPVVFVTGHTQTTPTSPSAGVEQLSLALQKTGRDEEVFVMYRNERGESVCRIASAEEKRRLSRRGEAGLTRIIYPGGTRPWIDELNAAAPAATETGTTLLPSAGIRIVLHGTQQLQNNPTARDAFIVAANRWEALISTPITVVIDADFGTTFFGMPFPDPDVLGLTITADRFAQLAAVRQQLISNAPGPEGSQLYNALPTTVPVELNGSAIASRVQMTKTTSRALGLTPDITNPDPLTIGQGDAGIGFNSAHSFDFTPDNGISAGALDFDAVVVHEIGHALGFTSESGVGAPSPLSPWDLFRFRPGTASLGTMATAPRVMTSGGSQVFFNNRTNTFQTMELALSTGGPSGQGGDGEQSSHWKDDVGGNPFIGIMDPTLPSGQREMLTQNDIDALDTFGYKIGGTPFPPPPPPPPPPAPPNDNFANAQIIPGCGGTVTGTNVSATRETGEPNHSPDNNGGSRSVWYQWQAPSTSDVTITTAGSDFDTVLGVYVGNSVGSLTLIARSDDDLVTGGVNSRVMFSPLPGSVYWIAVDGYNNFNLGGDEGSITLTLTAGNCSTASTVLFSNAAFSVSEGVGGNGIGGDGVGFRTITVQRFGPNIFTPASVDYTTSDGSAEARKDYGQSSGTLRFGLSDGQKSFIVFVTDDVFQEGPETVNITLSNPVGTTLGSTSTAVLTINSNDATTGPNPVDPNSFNTSFFVRQHYIDFFTREPDLGGLNFWKNQIDECTNEPCREVRRINVSAAFFLSIEFQQTGYLVYRTFTTAFGPTRIGSTVPLTLTEFVPDVQRIGQGVIIGQPGAEALLEANKQAYFNEFVGRPQFLAQYPLSMTAAQFVDALNANAMALSQAERDALVTDLGSGAKTRAQVLRAVAEDSDLVNAHFNRAFVLMQYFGYLRRNPNDPPEATLDFQGYNFWLNKLNQFSGNFVNAEMVKAFITSTEYRQRFGP